MSPTNPPNAPSAPKIASASSAGSADRRKGASRYDRITFRACKPAENFADWKGVWVIVEHRDGNLRPVTLELLGAARPMAEKLGHKVTAVILGHQVTDLAAKCLHAGADEVILAQHPVLKTPLARPSTDVLNKLIEEHKPNIVLIGATHTGRDISSRVAATLDAGMTADCTELDVDAVNGELLARRPAFGGKMLATIRCDRHRPQMATARPGIFKPLPTDAKRSGKVHNADVKWLDKKTYAAQVVDYVIDDVKADVTKADVLVAGGMGIGGPEGFAKLEELAEALGGQVACSRPVADKGWMDRARQVGQTGVSVRPKLYVAVGISGAIQHIEGMKESGTIIAINSDPSAAIFQYADLGLVGDWKGHVDALIAEAKKRKLANAKWMVPVKDTLDADRQAAAERAAKATGKPVAKATPAETQSTQSAPKSSVNSAGSVPAPAAEQTFTAEKRPKAHHDDHSPAPKNPPTTPTAPTAKPASAGSASSADTSPEATDGKFTGNPKDVAAVKAFAKNVPEEKKAWVLAADCIVCNGCQAACPTDAAIVTDMARVDRDLCIADGACFDACPTGSIRPGKEIEAQSGGWPKGSRLAGKFGVPEP